MLAPCVHGTVYSPDSAQLNTPFGWLQGSKPFLKAASIPSVDTRVYRGLVNVLLFELVRALTGDLTSLFVRYTQSSRASLQLGRRRDFKGSLMDIASIQRSGTRFG